MMKFLGKLLKAKEIPHIINNSQHKDESEYYENLFVNSDSWSLAVPNEYEQERWKHIYIMLNFVKGFFYTKQTNPISILDFGCGRGWLTYLLNQHGYASGVEPVEKVIAHAKKLFPNLDFTTGSKEYFFDKARVYDLIVSSEVIEHIVDEEKPYYFREFYRALNENGFLIVTTPRAEAYDEWRKYTNPNQPVEDWISEEEVLHLALTAGFSKVDMVRYSEKPNEKAPAVEVYQVWLFKK